MGGATGAGGGDNKAWKKWNNGTEGNGTALRVGIAFLGRIEMWGENGGMEVWKKCARLLPIHSKRR